MKFYYVNLLLIKFIYYNIIVCNTLGILIIAGIIFYSLIGKLKELLLVFKNKGVKKENYSY